jgi:predicted nucleotidyltransferase
MLSLSSVSLIHWHISSRALHWDKALELAEDVKNVYGEQSMQYAVAAKSAALVGLKLATVDATETALQLLDAISPGSTSATPHRVRNILSITPELKLSSDDLDRWLRFAMNETPLPPRK